MPRQVRELATDVCTRMFKGGGRKIVVSKERLQRCVQGVESYILDLTPPDEAIGEVAAATGRPFDWVKRKLDKAKRRVIT